MFSEIDKFDDKINFILISSKKNYEVFKNKNVLYNVKFKNKTNSIEIKKYIENK